MADSLVTFFPITTPATPAAIPLGTEDCWVKVTRDAVYEKYEVFGTFVRNDPGDASTNTTAPQRLSAEEYFNQLIQDLGGIVPVKNIPVDLDTLPVFHRDYPKGTLDNPYTGLNVEDLYLISARMEDEGGRSYDIVFEFVKAAIDPTVAEIINFNGTDLGDADSWMTINYDDGKTVITVNAVIRAANRTVAENYGWTIADTLKVKSFENRDGKSLPKEGAVSGTLTNPATGYTLNDCYCIAYRSQDDGNNSYLLTFTFSTPDFDTKDPGDNAIPAWSRPSAVGPTDIGNAEGDLRIEYEYAFTTYIVTASFIDPAFKTYGQTLVNALGPSLVSRVEKADGAGLLKNPCGELGTLTLNAVSYNNLYFEDIDFDYKDDRVDMTVKFVEVNN